MRSLSLPLPPSSLLEPHGQSSWTACLWGVVGKWALRKGLFIPSFNNLFNANSAIWERLQGQSRHKKSQPLETHVNVTTAISQGIMHEVHTLKEEREWITETAPLRLQIWIQVPCFSPRMQFVIMMGWALSPPWQAFQKCSAQLFNSSNAGICNNTVFTLISNAYKGFTFLWIPSL